MLPDSSELTSTVSVYVAHPQAASAVSALIMKTDKAKTTRETDKRNAEYLLIISDLFINYYYTGL